jgi:hypothetical protein
VIKNSLPSAVHNWKLNQYLKYSPQAYSAENNDEKFTDLAHSTSNNFKER